MGGWVGVGVGLGCYVWGCGVQVYGGLAASEWGEKLAMSSKTTLSFAPVLETFASVSVHLLASTLRIRILSLETTLCSAQLFLSFCFSFPCNGPILIELPPNSYSDHYILPVPTESLLHSLMLQA